MRAAGSGPLRLIPAVADTTGRVFPATVPPHVGCGVPDGFRAAPSGPGERAVICPYCRTPDTRVVDSRTAEDGGAIRRRRQCTACERRFTTLETVTLAVVKRSGATEPFSREKVLVGVRKACQGRPVTEDDLALLAVEVEDAIRSRGVAEIPSQQVGLAILEPLRRLDEVAYLRFASVYRSFDSLDDFVAEIARLRPEVPAAAAAR